MPCWRQGAGCRLGSPAARALAPLGGMLHLALWMELDDGRGVSWCPVPVLAILRRPVLEPELHLRHVGYRLEDLHRRTGDRHQGGDQGQGRPAAWRRGDQGEGVVLEEQGVHEHRGWRALKSGSARVCEPAERAIIFSLSDLSFLVQRSVGWINIIASRIRS